MKEQPSNFDARKAGMIGGQPRVNSDFYINRDNGLGCNSLSSLSAGNTTLSKFAGEQFGGVEVRHGKYIGDIEVDVETVDSLPVHLIHPDSEHMNIEEKNTEDELEKNTEDRSSISSLTADLPPYYSSAPGMNRRDRSTLFSKNIRQSQRSSRAQFLVEGIRDAFDSRDQSSSIDYWGGNNGAQPWYSAQPNQVDQNNNHRSDERMSPSKQEVFVSTPEKDLITSEVHINKLIRSPEPSAHHNSLHLSSNDSPTRTAQNGNVGFFAYVYGRYNDYSRNKRIIILLFLFALLGACVGVIAASVGTKEDDSLSNKNDKFASFEDIAYHGSQLSLEEALPNDFIDVRADAINGTDTQSNSPSSSSSTMKESGGSVVPTPSPFISSSSQTTFAPSQQPSSAPTPMPSSPPSTPPTAVATPMPSHSPTSRFPTHEPSRQPSHPPTPQPSRRPTQQPSVKPTRRPTPRPTPHPTPITLRPSTENPTRRPTEMPSPKPSSPPSKEPSKSPSLKPTTLSPSKAPTLEPSKSPTHKPTTLEPSKLPTLKPSTSPTHKPTTLEPSKTPTLKPSSASPTDEPSWSPSAAPISSSPTSPPSDVPTTLPPSSSPLASPTPNPSTSPFVTPTVKPITIQPSRSPTSNPITYEPSSAPSTTHTSSPLTSPTPGPSILAVTTNPPTPITLKLTAAPTIKVPTSSPVSDPTGEPSVSVTSLETTIYPTTYAPTVA